jgi:alpha-galactosidase
MLAKTPPMGWNSWNTFGSDISEELVRETIDVFVNEGLRDAGYEYVVIDDMWAADERVSGRLTWDLAKFPNGIKPLADYAHSQGLKFGIYSCCGTHTCGNKPASFGYEETDAETFAEWAVDFLKYDYCHAPAGIPGPMLFQRMGQALRTSGRDILYSICEWGTNKPWEWGARAGGQMWRTTGDINDSWESIVDIGFTRQKGLDAYAGPGHWNDPDMLVVGMYGKGNVARGGCTDAEYRSHFSLWCLLAAPLMIGCDVRSMSDATRAILLNRELIAVNQDPFGRQAYCVGAVDYAWENVEVWARPLADGSLAVGLFNLGERNQRVAPLAWESLGLHDRRPCLVRDLWAGEDLGVFTREFSTRLDSHDARLIKLTPRP